MAGPSSLSVERAAENVSASHPAPALADPAQIQSLRKAIDARLARYLALQRAEYLRQPVFATIYDDLVEFACRPGKRLRSLLFLLAHRVFAGAPPNDHLTPKGEDCLLDVGISLEFLNKFQKLLGVIS